MTTCYVGRAQCGCPMEILLPPESARLLGIGLHSMTRRGWTVEQAELADARAELREGCPHSLHPAKGRKR